MKTSRKALAFIIGISFFISLAISNDFTPMYFVIRGLFLISFAQLWYKQLKASFILSSALLLAYSHQIGVFCCYFIQDFMPNSVLEDRILGYGAMGRLPFVFLSLLSIWFVYKSLMTRKNSWYIGFVILAILCSLGGDKGYGSNYIFKIVILAMNFSAFQRIKKGMSHV